MAATNPQEVAVIEVRGTQWQEWESVTVQHRWLEPYPTFEFTTAEPVPAPTSFADVPFNVGDHVTIYLAGIQAIDGFITIRQSAEDAREHGVQLQGKGSQWQFVKSSVWYGTSNFDGMTIAQVAQAVAAPFGVNVVTYGSLDETPFRNLQAAPGVPAFDFLEEACRQKATIIGSDSKGDLVLIGQHKGTDDGDYLIEGQNITRINVIFSNETIFQTVTAVGQVPGDDSTWGISASQLAASVAGTDPYASAIVVPAEAASSQAELNSRALFEEQIRRGTFLTVTITVPGWVRNNGDLWRVGHAYHVVAPTHLPYPEVVLDAQMVTFKQDDAEGTTTTLTLVLPVMLNGTLVAQYEGLPGPLPSQATPQVAPAPIVIPD